MKLYKRNLIAAAILLILVSFLGMSFGMNFDIRFPVEYEGYYMIKKGDALLRAAHTHGMPFAIYSMVLAFIIPYLGFSDKMKNYTSWSAILMLIMPVALFLRGVTYPATTFDYVGFVGAFFFVVTAVLVLIGAIKIKSNQ